MKRQNFFARSETKFVLSIFLLTLNCGVWKHEAVENKYGWNPDFSVWSLFIASECYLSVYVCVCLPVCVYIAFTDFSLCSLYSQTMAFSFRKNVCMALTADVARWLSIRYQIFSVGCVVYGGWKLLFCWLALYAVCVCGCHSIHVSMYGFVYTERERLFTFGPIQRAEREYASNTTTRTH